MTLRVVLVSNRYIFILFSYFLESEISNSLTKYKNNLKSITDDLISTSEGKDLDQITEKTNLNISSINTRRGPTISYNRTSESSNKYSNQFTNKYSNKSSDKYSNKFLNNYSNQSTPVMPKSNSRNYSLLKTKNSVKSDEEYKYIMMLYNKQLLVRNILNKHKYLNLIIFFFSSTPS
jgi:hypothetical protein